VVLASFPSTGLSKRVDGVVEKGGAKPRRISVTICNHFLWIYGTLFAEVRGKQNTSERPENLHDAKEVWK
jgi:hypothetical protein